jgi:predicted dehydrogenase
MPETIRFGIIGGGGISRPHLRALAEIEGAEAVALADLNEETLNARAEEFGVPRRYRDWNDLLKDDAVQAVTICLPHNLHARAALDAARHRKHILTEKPMCLSLEECDRMIAAAEQNGVLLMVAQILRWQPHNLLARQWIREGRIGRIAAIHRRRMSEGSPNLTSHPWSNKPEIAGGWLLYGFGAHEYDALLWLLDTQVETVTATGNRNRPVWNDYDEIAATMRLKNGAVATMLQSLNCRARASDCIVIGSEGTLALQGETLLLNGERTEVPSDGSAFREQVQEFVDCIREGREPGTSGRNVRTTMQALEGVKVALREGRVVQAEEL